jgi:hypothetical protein
VCAPESAVISRADSPFAANAAMSDAALEPGPGRLALAALWLAVRESFRPSGTLHVGPPSCRACRLAGVSNTLPLRAVR